VALGLTACRSPCVVVMDSEQIQWLAPGQTYTAPAAGRWIVPDETMRLLLRRWAQDPPR